MIKERPLPSALYDEGYFLTSCEGYQEFIESDGEELSRRLALAFAVAEVKPGMQVLDVGSGRGEIVRECARRGAQAYGIDYASAANRLALRLLAQEANAPGQCQSAAGGARLAGSTGLAQADAKSLPFPNRLLDRVLMFDIVEHLHPWELQRALREARRVLKDDGLLVIHTAPNRWYDRYAYPWVRLYRRLTGQGDQYPRNPRELVPANVHVHVNEQDMLSLARALRKAGFRSQVWLDSPPQQRQEGRLLALLRVIAFGVPPFRWFFEREVYAVAAKARQQGKGI